MNPAEELIDLCQTEVTGWRERLVSKPYQDTHGKQASEQQKLVRAAACSSKDLAQLMLQGANAERKYIERLPGLPFALTANETLTPQIETGEKMHAALAQAGVTRSMAASGVFWLLCHTRWLFDGRFPDPPAYAFFGPKADQLGDRMLRKPSEDLTPKQRKFIDRRVRDLLRRTGGIPHIRDSTAFIYDTPLAAAWWRVELCRAAAGVSRGAFTARDAWDVLLKRAVWEEWTRWVTRRAGKLAAPAALAAFVIAVRGLDPAPDTNAVKKMMANLARRAHGLHLGVLSPAAVAELCRT